MNTTTAPTAPKPRRRWLQFSLRTLLVLTLVVSLPLGWLGAKVKQAREQRKAVEAIERLGGWAGCEPRSSGALRTVAAWLITSVGEDLSLDVVAVYLGKDSDAGVPNLGGVTQLYGLSVDSAQVTDAWLERLRGLSEVRCLWLNGTQVTDAGLTQLHGMRELQGLILDDTQVTDAGVAELQTALPNISISYSRKAD
jgi:hypothetical protein